MESRPRMPESYTCFLFGYSGEACYHFDGMGSWRLANDAELSSVVRIDGRRESYLRQLRAYSESIRSATGEDMTEDGDGNPFPLDRLAAGLAIGENNGDVMFLDPVDGHAVWLFHVDGGDVERLAASFADWLEAATVESQEE